MFILHAGGKSMSDIILSQFEDQGNSLQQMTTFSSPRNIPGEILQIEVQHDTLPSNSKKLLIATTITKKPITT